ncbi:pectinesterase inhibitor-like [Cucumis melo var. makuwa]|uniref:Pectinesterase inhibitor-like n=1 Tax=Cucumis melo var. makuwa TaxID=1194695 RepID=A0A5D3CN86_CUCMM|nr:pectinesterase inhibitor-like [Cucumis melo var. makuwa]
MRRPTDLKGLAVYTLNHVHRNARKSLTLANSLAKTTPNPQLKQRYSSCAESYDEVVGDIENAQKDLALGDFNTVNIVTSGAMTDIDDCQDNLAARLERRESTDGLAGNLAHEEGRGLERRHGAVGAGAGMAATRSDRTLATTRSGWMRGSGQRCDGGWTRESGQQCDGGSMRDRWRSDAKAKETRSGSDLRRTGGWKRESGG